MKKETANKTVLVACRFTEEEIVLLESKMLAAGFENKSQFIRKMVLDGYVVNTDYTEFKETVFSLTSAVNKIGVNVNQIAKRVNETGSVYKEDIDEIREGMKAVWQLLKSGLSNLLHTLP